VKGIKAAPPLNGLLYTEEDWNETSTVAEEAYWVSKRDAERAAWQLAKQHGLDLVTILPNFVMGPVLSAALPDPTSVGFLKAWLEGTPSTGSITFAPDVRDVAHAHILAALTPQANGRYIVSDTTSASPAFISRTLQQRFPQFAIPDGEEAEAETTIDNVRVMSDLGLRFTPLATTLVDMAVTLVALGIAVPKLKPGQTAVAEEGGGGVAAAGVAAAAPPQVEGA
jgi:nucleoside-diphosphate-sugar epimerase